MKSVLKAVFAASLFVSLATCQYSTAADVAHGGAIRRSSLRDELKRTQDVHNDGHRGTDVASTEFRTAGLFTGFRLPVPQQWQNRQTGFGSQTWQQPARSAGNCPNGNCGSSLSSGYTSNRQYRDRDNDFASASEWTPRTTSRDNRRSVGRGIDPLILNPEYDRFSDRSDLNRLSGTGYFRTARPGYDLSGLTHDADCPDGRCGTRTGNCPNGRCGTTNGNCPNGQCGTTRSNCPNGQCGTQTGYNRNCPNGQCGNNLQGRVGGVIRFPQMQSN